MSKKPGLYANIHAKRKRGEKMRAPGEEGAPSAQDFKDAAKTAKKKKGAKRQDPGRMMYDKVGCKMCDGGKKPCRCGKADMGRKGPYSDGSCMNRGDIAAEFNAVMISDAEREDKPCGNSYISQNEKCSKGVGKAKKAGTKPSDFSLRQLQGSGPAAEKRRAEFYKAKGTTKGVGNKIKRAGEFAANVGSGAAIGVGATQAYAGLMSGNLGMASRGVRNVSLGASAAQLAGASKASRLGNKGLAKEFSKSAGKLAAFGVGQEAALGGIAGYKRTGGSKNLRRRMTQLRQTASRRAQGVRSYQGGGMEMLPGSKKKRR